MKSKAAGFLKEKFDSAVETITTTVTVTETI